jgi:hypothetical protein
MAKPLLSRDERRTGEVETIEQRERDSKRICFRDRVECIVRAVEPTASPLGVGNHSRYTYMLHLPPHRSLCPSAIPHMVSPSMAIIFFPQENFP